MMGERALVKGQIHCDMHGANCPKQSNGGRYRGIYKCWGCPSATWQGSSLPRKPYGMEAS